VGTDSDLIARIGVHGVAALFLGKLGWIFREQHESDHGIDAIVEIAVDGRPTGKLIAIQIKSGSSYFAEDNPGSGWIMRGPKRHLNYWLEYQLPVLVVLFNPRNGSAYWVHVNQESATYTSKSYKINVPTRQVLDASARDQIEQIVERWVPLRGDSWSRARNAIAQCLAEGIPVSPSDSLWDMFVANSGTSQSHGWQLSASVLTYNLPLVGESPAALVTTNGGVRHLTLADLRGTWSVASGSPVYVCENPLVLHEAIQKLGTRCKPLVCLRGFPNSAVQYLLLALGFCGASIRVHTDHDPNGRRMSELLFSKTIDYEDWCPNPAREKRTLLEEQCLPYLLEDLRI
jgi:uncharacterized protein DUF4365/uncharacterized protein DUF2399